MRPIIRVLEQRGAEVLITARDFAQTLGLAERHGLAVEAIGRHRGGRLAAKGARPAVALGRRSRAGRAGGGSTSRSATAPTTSRSPRGCCGIPSATAFDYEWAKVQHTVNCRLAQRGRRAGRDPARAAAPVRRHRRQAAAATRGSRRSTTWRTSSPTRRCSPSSGSTPRGRSRSCARRRPSRSTTASRTRCSAQVLDRLRGEQAVVLPRTPEQRAELGGLHRPRAGDRRAVAGRVRRPRDLRRRHDEPRGGGARHAGVDHVRGPPGRGRRGADRRRAAAPAATAPRTLHWKSVRRRRGERIASRPGRCSPTCCCPRSAVLRPPAARSPRITRDAPPDPLRGLSRPPPRTPAGRAGRGAGRAGLLPRLPPSLRRRRSPALRRPVRAHDRVRDLRQRRRSSRCSGSTGTGCATRRSASTCRSRRPSRSPCSRSSATSRSCSRS